MPNVSGGANVNLTVSLYRCVCVCVFKATVASLAHELCAQLLI